LRGEVGKSGEGWELQLAKHHIWLIQN